MQTDTPGEETGAPEATAEELYEATDWLLLRRRRIERTPAARHVKDGSLLLRDLTIGLLRGLEVPAGEARLPPRRQARQAADRLRPALRPRGLVGGRRGVRGNTADPGAVAARVEKLAGRFSLSRVVLVGDRGPLTGARIREDLSPAGLRWIPRSVPRRSVGWR